MNAGRRSRRVASLVQRTLANHFVRERCYASITISAVELSADLSNAKIYVTCLDAGAARVALIEALNADSARLRAQIAAHLRLRNTPRLRFIYDAVPEQAERLEQLMRGSPD